MRCYQQFIPVIYFEIMETRSIMNDLLLFLTAVIWGLAFVAQRAGALFIGPFWFNGIRFFIGSVSLVPVVLLFSRKRNHGTGRDLLVGGVVSGVLLFLGSTFQQIGIHFTTAGNAGFITSLYVVFVPFIGIFFGFRSGRSRWVGAVCAVAGLYLLGMSRGLKLNPGDLLVLVCALFFALHVIALSYYSPKTDPLMLSCIQFGVTSVLSLIIAVFYEHPDMESIRGAAVPVLYGGIMSVGVAYTLQVIAQKRSHPAHAAILLSMEGAFAALGGWLILGELMNMREIAGCLLMLAGVLAAQWDSLRHEFKATLKRPLPEVKK